MISLRPERLLLLAALVALPGVAQAQALACIVPDTLPVARPRPPEPARLMPTVRHTLALSWSPQYCRGRARDTSFQCSPSMRFGFILHGFWPEGADGAWPQYCRPPGTVPPRVVREMLCTSPSADLLQNEWARHGTCGWRDAATYFATGRRLFQALRFPDMAALSRRRDLTVDRFKEVFTRLNARVPGLTPAGVRVRLGPGGWLEEVWLCLDRRLGQSACPADQRGDAAAGQRLRIWRGDPRP